MSQTAHLCRENYCVEGKFLLEYLERYQTFLDMLYPIHFSNHGHGGRQASALGGVQVGRSTSVPVFLYALGIYQCNLSLTFQGVEIFLSGCLKYGFIPSLYFPLSVVIPEGC